MPKLVKTYRFPLQESYVGGDYRHGNSHETFISEFPATGEVLCELRKANQADINYAHDIAHESQKEWAAVPAASRGRILKKAAELLRAKNDELAELEVLDTGKPIQEAKVVDVASGADCIEYYGGIAASLHGEHYDFGKSFGYTRREPIGLCVGIGAWNYPLQIACWKSAPALACGNTFIYKPASLTPLTALKLAEIYSAAGLPDGVFNVVLGDGKTGSLLINDPRVRKISLTGSTPTGKSIMASAATHLQHITLELGGKSPLIIFADAHLENAVAAAMMANFYTQGEVCTNGTRVFVEEKICARFLRQLKERTRNLVIGNPLDERTQLGSLISKGHLESVLAYIDSGKKSARLFHGGNRYMDNGCDKGYFVEPTIFTEVADDAKIACEEIFGPVMSIMTFREEDEVIQRANKSDFGLAAAVFTRDLTRAHRVISLLEAGTCWINNYNITPIELPFGGYKHSGIGRENGLAAIEHYTQLKSVYVEMGDVETTY